MINGTLALATSIAAMSREELSELIANRRIVASDSISDALGLAIELLRTDSIIRALRTAHRDWLRALIALETGDDADAATLDALRRRGLVGLSEGTGAVASLPEVSLAVGDVSFEDAPSDVGHDIASDTSGWFGQALTSVRRAAELLRRLARRPVRLGRKGTLTVIGLRELAQEKQITVAAASHLLSAMQVAGLLTDAPGHGTARLLVPTQHAQHWLTLDYPDRWLTLAEAALRNLDEQLRDDLIAHGGGLGGLISRARYEYPLLPDAELEQLRDLLSFCEELGISAHGRFTSVALELLDGGAEAARALTHEAFPTAVEGVYLQPDLSLIVPGPLEPSDEAALAAIAESEQLGAAATMRLSQVTLERAAQRGFPPHEVRSLLERLSLTGIPQPLDFLLSELERQPPVTPHDAQRGELYFAAPAPATPTASTERSRQEALIERVLDSASSGDGDLSRRLELAIRHRRPVQVTAVAGAQERAFTLLPLSLRGGRLRATDQQAGVERTLPVSAITAVEAQ